VQLHRADRTGDLTSEEVRHASAEAVYDYLAALVPAPARRPTGELCAIDLDGVLESDRLGYPATTPLGMLAVRALQAHGLRPVIVTGRSLDEAVARARILGLDAAVGEYGAAAWVGGTELDLRTGEETAAVDRVRTSLGPSVEQASYRHIVRATLAGGPLPGVLEPREPSVRCVRGAQQTDIVPRAVDKGRGLAALSSSLGGVGWALAVGDTAEDLPMLAAATSAWAPSNAAAVVRAAGVRITRAPYQAGLAQAVASLLGHAPGRCDVCRPPRPGRNSRAVLAMLALPESGSRGLPVRALGASVAALRTEQRR
jgi:hydroxymethylpyrimidine pyrophosphatase-like HAD family hydrolase